MRRRDHRGLRFFYISVRYSDEGVEKSLKLSLVAEVGKSGSIADFEIVDVAFFEMLEQSYYGGMNQMTGAVSFG